MFSWITHDPNACLSIRSLNFRADHIMPLVGPSIVMSRATFTVHDTTSCEGDDANLAVFLVFSSPQTDNETYVFT